MCSVALRPSLVRLAAASYINPPAASAARIQSAAAHVPPGLAALTRGAGVVQRFGAVSLGPGSAVSGPLAPATGRGENWLE